MLKNIKLMLVVVFVSFAVVGCKGEEQPIGIISAMDVELEYLLSQAKIEETYKLGDTTYSVGKLSDKKVVIVKSGVGKSLSAAVTSVLIDRFNVKSIIFTGIAGGVGDDVKITDVVISTKVMFHDYGFYGNDNKLQIGGDFLDKVEIEADPNLVEAAYKTAVEVIGKDKVYKGIIATGDQFMANEKYVKYLEDSFNVLAVEMEGASVGYVASKYKLPFVIIRSMSDKADGLAHKDYDNWYKIVADNSGKIVVKLLDTLN